jgi:chorismate dehydratase
MADRLRVGAVTYLNAKPLVEGLADDSRIDLSFDLPSRLADQLARGEIDVGLVPVVELFRGDYTVVPDIAIASRGPVLSVTLFSRVPWNQIESVSLDEGSRTSAALAQVLLREKYGRSPRLEQLPITVPADDVSTDAVLLIGDRAMKACLPGYPFAYDLGQEWADWTGLPMVFAVWAVRPGVELGAVEAAFHRAKRLGSDRAGAIAAREAPGLGLDAGFCRRYLDTIITYDFGPKEREGMERFRQLTGELGLISINDDRLAATRGLRSGALAGPRSAPKTPRRG